MTLSIEYRHVRAGDLIWNKHGYSGPKGHWTRVLSVETAGDETRIRVVDGYTQTGHPREGITVNRERGIA